LAHLPSVAGHGCEIRDYGHSRRHNNAGIFGVPSQRFVLMPFIYPVLLWASPMIYAKFPGRCNYEAGVTFVGEQDGEPERELKSKLADVLSQFPSVQRAYLARVNYVGSDQMWVALCLYGASASVEIGEACSRPFRAMFNHTQSLDMLFISSEQEIRLATVCQPFYRR
jgi:hypothetical protein